MVVQRSLFSLVARFLRFLAFAALLCDSLCRRRNEAASSSGGGGGTNEDMSQARQSTTTTTTTPFSMSSAETTPTAATVATQFQYPAAPAAAVTATTVTNAAYLPPHLIRSYASFPAGSYIRPPYPAAFAPSGEILYHHHHHHHHHHQHQYPPPPHPPPTAAATAFLPAHIPYSTLVQPKLSCYNCGSQSHHASDCAESTLEEASKQGRLFVYLFSYTITGGGAAEGFSSLRCQGEISIKNVALSKSPLPCQFYARRNCKIMVPLLSEIEKCGKNEFGCKSKTIRVSRICFLYACNSKNKSGRHFAVPYIC